ncbi:MAG: ArsR/SmtB family transcription factor [Methanotrichaceae archaeon]
MSELEDLAEKLNALGHPLRLRIIAVMAREKRDMYLSEIASVLVVNRALAKIHLKKLEKAGFVKSRVALVEGEAKALRYYQLNDFNITISPEQLMRGGLE